MNIKKINIQKKKIKNSDIFKYTIYIDNNIIGYIKIQSLKWDTEFFNFSSAKIDDVEFNDNIDIKTKIECFNYVINNIKKIYKFITCKANASNIILIHLLEFSGFKLINNALIFKKIINPQKDKYFISNNIISCNKKYLEQSLNIAESIYSLDRFHLDYRISKEKADLLQKKWLENSFKGLSDKVFLYKKNKDIAGFITCKINFKKEGIIDLIGVLPTFQGQSVGSNLIDMACHWFQNQKITDVFIGTQSVNYGASNFYFKKGFKLYESIYNFHFLLL